MEKTELPPKGYKYYAVYEYESPTGVIEYITACRIKKTFRNRQNYNMFIRLHNKKCEYCSKSSLMTLDLHV